MPIPFIIGGIAIVSGLYGAKKAKDAKDNYSSAKSLVGNALSDFVEAKEILDSAKQLANNSLKELGELRLIIQSEQMLRYIEAMKKVNNVKYKDIENENSVIEVTAPQISEIQISAYKAVDLVKDGIGALSAGALAGIGAGGLATSIGVASTGTAIGSLTGVAATNATLAWLGGGSLAAGGMGVAGGTAILGGAIAGPVIAVMGFAYAKKSEKALTEAFKKESEIREAIAQVENGTLVVNSISQRVLEISNTTVALSEKFTSILKTFTTLIDEKTSLKNKLINDAEFKKKEYAKKNIFVRIFNKMMFKTPAFSYSDALDFNNFHQDEKNKYMLTMNMAISLYSILKVKVLNDEGSISAEGQSAVNEAQLALEA